MGNDTDGQFRKYTIMLADLFSCPFQSQHTEKAPKISPNFVL